MSLLDSLPAGVLKLVMHHVPQQDRLSSCSLVNKRLHAAAVAATEQLTFGPPEDESQERSFVEYLMHYGKHVTSLHMDSTSAPIWMLPCPNLQELVLSECDMLFGPGAFGLKGVIPGCFKLTRLNFLGTIKDADLLEGDSVELDCLSSLVHLQHLELVPSFPVDGCTLSAATLPRLQHLTHLNVYKLSAESLAQLGSLTKLQELSADIAPVGPSTVPGLTFPASLTKLVLGMGPAVEARILSLVPAELKHLAIECDVEGPAEGPGSFLAGMARLQHLTHLELCPPEDISLPPRAGPAYAALTASSKLVEFKLFAALLPKEVWSYMFHDSDMLPHLTSLSMCEDDFGKDPVLASAWDAGDFWSVVRCCPSLCELPQAYMVHGDHVSRLQRLTGVTSLMLGYGGSYEDEVEPTIEGLAAVTQLRELTVYLHTAGLTVGALLPLTSLTALTDLKVVSYLPSDPESDFDEDEDELVLEVCLQQEDLEVPAVWLQLLHRCMAEHTCQRTALCNMAQQLCEQRRLADFQQQQILKQQQQLSTQQHLTSDQQQQIAAQQQQLLAQQHQLSAQEQAAAEQGSVVAGLQGQLQELQSQLQYLLQRQQQ